MPLKNGRFTIQAVQKPFRAESCLANQSQALETSKQPPTVPVRSEASLPERKTSHNKNQLFLKKTRSQIYKQNFSKHVFFHIHNNSLNNLKRSHSRTGSLPLEKKLSQKLLKNTVDNNEKSNSFSESPNLKYE